MPHPITASMPTPPTRWLRNLVPVTLGNIVGGARLVGDVYWFIYLRSR